jgi:hypothetical protein
MRSHEVDREDLLYSWYPLPEGEACHFWLRTAWDFIEEGKEIPSSIAVQLEHWGIDVPEFIAWAEVMIEHFEDRPIIYRSLH